MKSKRMSGSALVIATAGLLLGSACGGKGEHAAASPAPAPNVVVAEVDCGWVPYFKEQIDNNYRRLDAISDFRITALPSEYVARHLHFTYLTDPFGIANRHVVGVERILWSSDYPHISSDWPHSWDAIETTFAGVDTGEREAILHGNAQRLYSFGR